MFGRSMVRTLAFVLAAALPASALAAGPADGSSAAEHGKGQVQGRGGKDSHEAKFPMKGAEFITMVDVRIAKVRARVQEKLAQRALPDVVKKQVMVEVDAGSAKVKAAAARAAADGTVTKDEAKGVRDLAKQVMKDLRAKAGLPPHEGREGGKGKGKGKGKAKA